MFKESKYYGEVWFVDKEESKCFCVLVFENGKVALETNLSSKYPVYKYQIILGAFTGLGYITFIDCKIKFSQSGITEGRIYHPKYSFISAYHFIEPVNLKFKKFQISNDAIVDWIHKMHWYSFMEDKLVKHDDICQKFKIDEIGLSIELEQSSSSKTGHKEFVLKNNGYLNFESDKEISLLTAFDYYNTFQELLQFITSRTKQFSSFSFQCLSCGEWANIYYQEDRYEKSGSGYIHLLYDEVSNDLPTLINNIYTSKSFKFCLNKLMENLLGVKLSHSRRFTNSISTFEAYNKLYTTQKTKKLINYLRYNKEHITTIGKIDKSGFDDFLSKIIRSRDYHVHSNLKNKNIFSDFELLYISFLLDFVVGFGLLQEMNVSKEILDKVIMQGQSVFIDMQRTNKILRQDTLKDKF
ncbi:HEPN domain-containing protein [Tenacibaculum discolor]|uniref:ApeA N-terminal domain 1-containing protein n=1 Tax=Tenacibaculum discolor TaxID=361581 RepID=UPI003F78AF30